MEFNPARFAALRAGQAQGATPASAEEASNAKLMSKLKAEIAAFDAARSPKKVDVEQSAPKSRDQLEAELKAQQETEDMENMEAKFGVMQPEAATASTPKKSQFTDQQISNARAFFGQLKKGE